jgi:hypothetical protein
MEEVIMSHVREPLIHPVKIADLRPTQITVGMHEVLAKRRRWQAKSDQKASDYLGQHMVPVIMGPKEHLYLIDHHHLARALLDEGQQDVLVTVIADLARLEQDSFWFVLDNHNWLHPFDQHGRRRDYADVPKSVKDLVDDPYRSLAGGLRALGGYAKDTTPFSEFLWADFLRRRIDRNAIDTNFDLALQEALTLAKSQIADYLPGWCGPYNR